MWAAIEGIICKIDGILCPLTDIDDIKKCEKKAEAIKLK